MKRMMILGAVMLALTGCVSDGPRYGGRPYPVVVARERVDVYRAPTRYDRGPVYRPGTRRIVRSDREYDGPRVSPQRVDRVVSRRETYRETTPPPPRPYVPPVYR